MLDAATKRRIDDARDILVGKIPDPKSQVEQITIALIYKFMDDMDTESEELGGTAKFFVGDYKKYSWRKVFNKTRGGQEILLDYREALQKMSENPSLPTIFHTIFRQAYLPYNDPETLKEFLKIIDQFDYDHSEKLGDAFEYLLSVLGSQGDAGQFRTPRHIIDFMVELVEPKKGETILDPACGTAGFLISAYKYILKHNSSEGKDKGDLLTPDERKRLSENISGYDISPDMVRLSLVNMYLHKITEPKITEYDTLTSDTKWNEYFDVVLANPPFMSPKGGIKPHSRFSVQSKRSEALFVDYITEHLTITGRGAVIVPEGVIFKSDTAFTKLRKMLVEDHYLYGVISLPSGVFNPYSGVKTSILLFDKVISKLTDKILFAKVENDGFGLGAQRRPVEGSQLESIVSAIKEFKIQLHRGEEFESSVCTFVEKSKIAESCDYNLSGERYFNLKPSTHSRHNIVRLGDVLKTSSGGTPSKDVAEYYENGTIPWLRSGEVSQGYIHSAEICITESALQNSSAKMFPVNTVLIAMYGATAGQVGILKFESATNQAICGILPDKNILPEYIYYILKSQKDELIRISTGGAQPNISQAIIKDIKFPLLPIEEQRAIVAEIEGYQKIIDAACTIADNYRPQITIDPNWQMVELGEVIKLSSGNGLTSREIKEGNYPIYGGNGIISYHNEYFVEEPTIVIGRVGAYCGSVHITEPRSWITDNGLYVVNFKIPVAIKYLANIIKNLNLNQYAKVGGQPSISQSTVYERQIPLPDLESQQQIVAEIEREQVAVDSAKELIEIFTKKITNRIAQIWNE